MVLNLHGKKKIVTEMNKLAKNSLSIVIADFCGVVSDQMTYLRKLCRDSDVRIHVIRNTLMYRIVQGTDFECLKNSFVGPNLVAFSITNVGTAARLFKNFSKNNINFKIKMAAFNSEIIQESQIDYLVNLPTYKEAIANFISVIKFSSIGKLLRILSVLCNQKN